LTQLWPTAASRCLGRLIPQGEDHRNTFNASAAFSGRLTARWIEHTLDREYCSEAADAGGGIGAQVALRKAEKMGDPKTENAVLCASSLHTSAGAMDRNGGDPVHEISIAELVARGSAQLNRMAGLSRPAKIFTSTQGQYLAFIYAYTRLHRRPPAETDMQQYFRVSPPSVHQMVLTLERAGFIRRQPGVARSIEMLVDPNTLPVLR
jgi:hypothetical protein